MRNHGFTTATVTSQRWNSLTVCPGSGWQHGFVLLSAAVAGLALVSACGHDGTTAVPPEPDPPRATMVTVTPEAVSLSALDDTVRLAARVLDQNGQTMANAAVTWSTSGPSVAAVDVSGLVTAAGNGSATVTATSGAASGSAAVTVAQEVTAVAVQPATDTLFAGDTLRLAASATDANGNVVEGASFLWTSADTAVARVDEAGLVTGIAPGRTAVLAMSGAVTAEAQVTVMASPVAQVVVTPEAASLTALGDTVRLSAEVLYESGQVVPGLEVAWSSANTMVATVDVAGLVTAVGTGESAVTAAVHGVSGEARVSVTQSAHSVAVSPATATIVPGDTLPLSGEALDANGHAVAEAEFVWSSSDPSVATVEASGIVRGVSEGKTTITARAGEAQGISEITVAQPDQAALIALYRATDGPNWANKENWLTDIPLGRWHGVETNEYGRVTRLTLPENLLVGTLPVELGHLTHLETLNLSENRLTGPLPPEIGNATRLREIELGHTELDGAIPATLGRLVHLRNLNFEYASFSGPIPPELGALAELRFLNLYQNRLSGRFPGELAGLRSLRTIFVDENRLTGTIPSTFTQLQDIETFYWHYNEGLCAPGTTEFETWRGARNLKGPRCNEADLDALERFYHSTDGANWTRSTGWLEGAAPEQWHGVDADSLGLVTVLDLSGNGLRGRLPASVAELGELSVLRVGDNALSGSIPQGLAALSLVEFRYGDTELCVPQSVSFQAWLAAIAVREGTDDQCPPLSVREILELLYEATGGEEWRRRDNWLTDAPLGDWHGVTTDGAGNVVELALYGNNLRGRVPPELGGLSALRLLDLSFNWLGGRVPPDLGYVDNLEEIYLESNLLTGPIPAELGALPSLTSLYLYDNRLEGTIPPELGGLSTLRDLRISKNRLTGRIPPELGDLSAVLVIWMDDNQFEGEIPPELANLSSLQYLYAGFNKLSGTIPAALGDLMSITDLAFDGNNLSGPIPGELGSLASLTGELNLRENNLSGEIPAELGNLVALEKLRLGSNDLSGPVPPELGRMRRLEWLDLSYNPELAGPLPSTFVNLRELTRFEGAGTRLCVAADSPLADPTAARRFRMPPCDPPAAVSSAYLVQSIQSASYPVPLLAGEDALLRVFAISPRSTDAHIPPARATFFVRGAEVYAVDVPGQSTPLPTDLAEAEASLDRSANVRIPASVVRPGLEMVVDIDPAGALDPGLGVARRIPESGRTPVLVEAMPTLDLTLVPFIWQSRPDSTAVQLTKEMARDPEGHRLLSETRTMLPVADLAVTAHPPVRTSANDSDAILDEVSAIRALEGGSGYWMGALSGEATGSWGVAWIDGWTSYVRVGIVDQPAEALTIAHELGHNMSLYHAPCGVSSVVDRAYPYPEGQTGSWGLDTRSGSDVLVPPTWTDLMSYCEPAWVSEYNFYLATSHRMKREASADRSAASGPALLVWGGIDGEGVPYLNPVFAVEAPPSLPTPGGDHEVLGRAADGEVLFSFRFDMTPMADSEGRAGFAYTIPSSPDWVGALAEIELTGPAGSVSIDETTNRPAAILRDRSTGQVRAILRDGPASATAAEAADGTSDIRMPGLDIEVLFSRGLPQAATRPSRR